MACYPACSESALGVGPDRSRPHSGHRPFREFTRRIPWAACLARTLSSHCFLKLTKCVADCIPRDGRGRLHPYRYTLAAGPSPPSPLSSVSPLLAGEGFGGEVLSRL